MLCDKLRRLDPGAAANDEIDMLLDADELDKVASELEIWFKAFIDSEGRAAVTAALAAITEHPVMADMFAAMGNTIRGETGREESTLADVSDPHASNVSSS
jgi:hypothetical protein